MKKLTIKFILISLILSFSILGGNVFLERERCSYNLTTTFFGYDNDYTVETNENYLTKIDLNENLTSSIPSSYDLRDYIEIKVEDQQTYTICYAFGCLTMLETYLALNYNEYYDFSEIHFATSKYVDNGITIADDLNVDFNSNNGGGNFYNFYDYCLKGSGPVLEVEMPMSQFYGITNVEEIENKAETYYKTYRNEFSNLVTVNQFVSFLDSSKLSAYDKIINRNKIKEHIMKNGSCSASIYSNTIGKYNNTQYLNSANLEADHMISIIGWDDNYKATDWANAGAYLCLNSWGENEYGGVFYVSYSDYNIEKNVYGISNAVLNSNNNIVSNYQSFLENNDVSPIATSRWNINSTGVSKVITITDVSKKINNYINEITISAYYPTNGTPEIYLEFFDNVSTKSNGNLSDDIFNQTKKSENKLSILSYSSITNNNGYLLGDTLFNIKLSSPVKITSNYAVLVIKTDHMFKLHGLETEANTNPLLNTYWNPDNSRIISGDNTSLLMLTSFNTSQNNSNQTNNIGKLVNESLIKTQNNYIFNNATYLNNLLTINIENPTNFLTNSNVEIYKVSATQTSLIKTDVTSNFAINKHENKIVLAQYKNIDLGLYIAKFTIGEEKFFKSFEIIEPLIDVPTHTITYNLNGGENNSYNVDTFSESLLELKLYHPTKTGYAFGGWYLDDSFTGKVFGIESSDSYGKYTLYDENLKSDLKLYAKWTLKTPTIVSQPKDIDQTYTGSSFTLSCLGYHELGEIKYQWYKNGELISGATTSSLKVKNVADSGSYVCKITYNYSNVHTNEVTVKISKGTYNLSWKNPTTFTFDNTIKTVDIVKNYPELKYNITNNQYKDAGNYTAKITFTSWNENYNTPTIEDLNWSIEKADIAINIHDVSVRNVEEFNNFTNFTYDVIGTIYSDYNLVVTFNTVNTENENIKLIKAVFTTSANYNITTNTAYIKIAKQTLTAELNNTNFTVFNEQGFVTDSNLGVTLINQQDLTLSNQKYLEDKNYIVYNVYDIQVEDYTLTSPNQITISISSEMAEKNLKVYKITENGMEELTTKIENNSLVFTSLGLGQFIIVEVPKPESMLPIVIGIGLVLLAGLFCCFIVVKIKKHRNGKYYRKIDFTPH